MTKPNYLYYIHYFRGFAILMIMGIHCRNAFIWEEPSFAKEMLVSVLDSSTVLFVIISGFLFQHINKTRFNFKDFFIKKMKFVMLPYLLISIPAILNNLILKGDQPWMPSSIEGNIFLEVGYMIITGKHLGPLWFMPMIFLFYLISPILHYLDKDWFYMTLFPILLISSFFTYQFGYFSNIPASFVHFLPIYFYGMFLSRYKEKIFELGIKLALPFALIYIIITVLHLSDMISIPRLTGFGDASIKPFFAFNLTKIKLCFLAIVLLYGFNLLQRYNLRTLSLLGDYSFGVYFIHSYFIGISQKVILKLQPDFLFHLIPFVIYTLMIVILSMLSVHIVKKIFGNRSRLIIGS